MVTKIEKLTDAQLAQMDGWAKKWIEIGLRTGEADWALFERAIKACYRFADLGEPVVVPVANPLVAVIAGPLAGMSTQNMEDQMLATAPETQTADAVQVATAAMASTVRFGTQRTASRAVDRSASRTVKSLFRTEARGVEEITPLVIDALSRLGRSVPADKVEAQRVVSNTWYHYLGGQFWAAWPAVSSFFVEVCGLELPGDLGDRELAYRQLTEAACWSWPGEGYVFVSNRPRLLNRDETGRLHSGTGPSLAWDGWSLYHWHGVAVPREWIEQRDKLDPKTALTWQNVEERRAAAEIIGWDKVLASMPHRVIDTDRDPMIGELLEVDLPDAAGSRFLRVLCGTGRQFCIPVPVECATALAAQGWIWQQPEGAIAGYEVRT